MPASNALATGIYYEDFAYTPGTDLAGLNGGTGFIGGWVSLDGGDPEPILPAGLTYEKNSVEMLVRGNSVRSYASGEVNGEIIEASEFRRDFTDIVPGIGDVYWFSYLLLRLPDTRSNSGYTPKAAITFLSGSRTLTFGANIFGRYSLTGRTNSSTANGIGPAVSVVPGATELLVLKATFNSGGLGTSDHFDLFLNPTPGLEPLPSEAALTLDFDLPSISELRYNSGEADGPGLHEWVFDEFHAATTYQEVAPAVPEPMSVGLLSLGAAMLGLRRFRGA